MHRQPPVRNRNGRRFAMASRGAWRHLAAAVMLITVLPGLVLLWLWMTILNGEGDSASALLIAGAACIGFAALGYTLLIKYPVSIVRLRSYLHSLAHDQLPDHVTLPHTEDDIAAIHGYLEYVVGMAAERLRLLEEKHAADLAAERHRIMTESVGTLCHHVGQPASVLGMQLHLLKRAVAEPEAAAMVGLCEDAYNDIMKTLDRLREITHYETEQYLVSESDDCRILRLSDV
jgi:hypothetical protein